MTGADKLRLYATKVREVEHWAVLYAAELDECHRRNGENDCHDDNCEVHWYASKLWTAEQDAAAAKVDAS